MSAGRKWKPWAWAAYAGWALACGAGCTSKPSASVEQGPAQRLRTLSILATPRDLLEDRSFPLLHTRQVLSWSRDVFFWKVDLPAEERAYAALVFRRPLILSARRARAVLRFRMKPVEQARRLYVAWVDGGARAGAPVVVRQPLAHRQVQSFGGWGYFEIPLSAFGNQGELEQGAPNAADADMDWGEVRELRLGVLQAGIKAAPVTLTQIQIGSAWMGN